MEAAFSWLSDLINFIGKLLPRLVIIRATHGGVKFKYGRYVHKLLPHNGFRQSGIHFYWPLVTEVLIYPIKRQTLNLPFQTLTTLDGETFSIGGIVTFEIIPEEIDKTLGGLFDPDETIRDISLASIADVILHKTKEQLCKRPNLIKKHVTARLTKRLAEYGVKVIYFAASDFTQAKVYRILGSESPKMLPLQDLDD